MSTMNDREVINKLNSLKVKFKHQIGICQQQAVSGKDKVAMMANAVAHLDRDITAEIDTLITLLSGQKKNIGTIKMKK